MGAWGVAILSDDIAEDIKLLYKDLLANEYSNEEASRIVIEEYKNELDDEETIAFWLVFASIQWRLGRLRGIANNREWYRFSSLGRRT